MPSGDVHVLTRLALADTRFHRDIAAPVEL